MRSVFVAPLCLAVLALIVVAYTPVSADDKPGTHEGTVVRAGNGKLTMTDKTGKNEHTHEVSMTAKITCDGKDCKLDDLQKGQTVKVTTEKKEGKEVATKIEAKKNDK